MVEVGLALVDSIRISSSVQFSNEWERACLRTLVLHERRVLFLRACFVPSIIDTRLEREFVPPRLASRFRIKAVSQDRDFSPSYSTPQERRCGQTECFWLV
jgi:hypothetical protein